MDWSKYECEVCGETFYSPYPTHSRASCEEVVSARQRREHEKYLGELRMACRQAETRGDMETADRYRQTFESYEPDFDKKWEVRLVNGQHELVRIR